MHDVVRKVEGGTLVAGVGDDGSSDGLLIVLELIDSIVETEPLLALAVDTNNLEDVGLGQTDGLLSGAIKDEGKSLRHSSGALNPRVAGVVPVVNSHEALAVLGEQPLDGVVRDLNLIAELLGELGAARSTLLHIGVTGRTVRVEATTAAASTTTEAILVLEATTGTATATTAAATAATATSVTELIIREARDRSRTKALTVRRALTSTAVCQSVTEDVEANLVSGHGHELARGELTEGKDLVDATLAGTVGHTFVQLQALDENLDGVAHDGEIEVS